MKIHRVKFAANVWERLSKHHIHAGKDTETLSYVFARTTENIDSVTVLVPHNAPVLLLDDDCFEYKSSARVALKNSVLNKLLYEFACSDYDTLINIHDHWFDSECSDFSPIDDADDKCFDQYLRDRFEPMLRARPDFAVDRPIFNLAIVLCNGGASARLIDTRDERLFQPLDIQIMGDHLKCLPANMSKAKTAYSAHWLNRHQDFIALQQQQWLAASEVFLVGAGGLGSILAESVARLGVGALTIVDHDELESSNLNRFQGGCPDDVGEKKVEVLEKRLKAMFPMLQLKVHALPIQDETLESVFARADLLVGALDDDVVRYYLNVASVQYMLPYFDGGVSVETTPAVDFRSRLSVVLPGTSACLQCSKIKVLDMPAVGEAYADPATRQLKQATGYVLDRPEVASPSVYSLNMACSAALMMELTNYLCGWRPTATNIKTEWQTGRSERLDRANYPAWPGEDCSACGYRSGLGGSEPLPRPSTQSALPPSKNSSEEPIEVDT